MLLNVYTTIDYISPTPTINFKFYNIDLFNKIKEYFETFNHGYFEHVTTLDEYEKKKSKLIFQGNYRSFISHLLYVCENPRLGILNCSLFGQCAIYEKGIQYPGNLKTDLDTDIILVCEKGKKSEVINSVKKQNSNIGFAIKVVWGPINDEFYSFRDKDTFNVDIELFEEGDEYYKENPLLGHSILPNCIALYRRHPDEHRLHKILTEPDSFTSIFERANVALKSKKGINDFKNQMDKYKGVYDPLRIFSHLIKNTSWVLSGEFQSPLEKAVEIIDFSSNSPKLNQIIKKAFFIFKNQNSFNYDDQINIVNKLVIEIEAWLNVIISSQRDVSG